MSKACLAAALAVLAAACGRSSDVRSWIGPRAAVVRCASPGRQLAPPVLGGVPAPLPPTGLLARALDPVALDDLGYERDTPVCAVLEAPSTAEIDEAARTLAALVEVQEAAAREALRVGGRCTCEVARALALRELVPTCVDAPTMSACDPTQGAEAVAQALAPVLVAIDETTLPWRHWRLVGRTDRPGWFVEHLDTLVAHHDGGSTVYLPGTAVPSRADPLVPILLELEHVVAVIRQDSGRSMLIAREMEGLLVLDHLTQPTSTARRLPLVGRVELARVTAMVSQLAPPESRREPTVAIDGATVIELDPSLLEDVDRAAIASSVLGEQPYRVADERWEQPLRLFDRITFAAPFGEQGLVLRIEHALSADGIAWAQTLGEAPLLGNLDGLGLADVAPVFEPAAADVPFVLRGTPTSRFAVHGVHRLPSLARALEIAAPGSLAGDLSAWRIDWHATALPADEPALYAGLRASMVQRNYRLTSSFDPARTRLTLEARPD